MFGFVNPSRPLKAGYSNYLINEANVACRALSGIDRRSSIATRGIALIKAASVTPKP